MTLVQRVLTEVAHHMGAVPLAWLLVRSRVKPVGPFWWLTASALFVSWIADSAAHFVDPRVVSVAYPVLQAGLMLAACCSRGVTFAATVSLAVVAICVVLAQGAGEPDWIMHTSAGLAVCIACARPGDIGRFVVAYFLFGAITWPVFVAFPGVAAWMAFQATRAAGIASWCLAFERRRPLTG